jgi:hypothetical protein
MELGETALRAQMPRLCGSTIPTRRLNRVSKYAPTFEIPLPDGEGRFCVARGSRRRK